MNHEALVDEIYEAAVMPDRWPRLLRRLSDAAGATAALVLAQTAEGLHGHEAEGEWPARQAYIAEGWDKDTTRYDWLVREPYPGFRTDLDFVSAEDLRTIPVYAEFLIPHGLDAGAATLISGLDGDRLLMSLEGFAGHDAARGAIADLDRLRPHISRAAMLTARLRLSQADAGVAALEMAGIGAAVITEKGVIRSSNARFRALLGDDAEPRLRLQRSAERRAPEMTLNRAGSIPIQTDEGTAVLHVLPVTGDARDIFLGGSALLIVAENRAGAAPDESLLRLLYDLTPAEARVAAAIATGAKIDAIAGREAVSVHTVRSQLKAIFSKTGLHSQTELALHLSGLTRPVS